MLRATNPFYLDIPERRADGSELPGVLKFARRIQGFLERISGLREMQRLYDELPEGLTGIDFVKTSLGKLNIGYDISPACLENIPKTGPVVLVSNHPFGGIEGVILMELLAKVRPDFKIMANSLLGRVKELSDHMILVDPFGEESSAKKNIGPLRESLSYVKKGGLLAIFPSGTVSHLQLDRKEVSDPDWSQTVGKIIRATKAPVVPMFICGSNGLLFQLLGLVHPLLRTAALPRELLNKQNTKVRFKVGKLIAHEKLNTFTTDKKLVDYLRIRSYIQADKDLRSHLIPGLPVFVERIIERFFGASILATEEEAPRHLEPVVKGQPKAVLAEEVDLLPQDQMLLESDSNQVWYARAEQIPHILQEIGRLREISFREVKEGTGRSIDLDTYDNYYIHLFVWNVKNEDVVGSYRMGRTDVVCDRYGAKGLYTSTLFDYSAELLGQIRPALELGRSFVRKEYQKTFSALLLLWKGIGHYVAKYPRYRYLFGPVSINNDYDSISRQLIISFLQANNYDPALAGMIRARNPLRHKRIPGVDPEVNSIVVGNVAEISELLQEVESSQTDIPVLLRQYIKLGGKLLGFNVDPSFGGVLDGLLLVDLLDTESRLLQRYLSKEGAADFLEFHEKMGTRSRKADEPESNVS